MALDHVIRGEPALPQGLLYNRNPQRWEETGTQKWLRLMVPADLGNLLHSPCSLLHPAVRRQKP